MTVEELISILKQQPADLEVVVQSYEDGYDPVTDVDTINILPAADKQWYYGVYDKSEHSGDKAVFIRSRYNRAEKGTD